MSELRKRFEGETGKTHLINLGSPNRIFFSDEYVKWLESKQSEWVSESDAIRMIRFAYDKGIDWTNRHRTKNCMSVDDVVHHLVPQKG